MLDIATLLGLILLPLLLTIPLVTAIALIIKDPEPIYTVIYIVLATVTFLIEESVATFVFNQPLYTPAGLQWVFSSITQGFLALIGILGSFLVFNLQSLREISMQVRHEVIKNIPNFDFSKMVVDDKNFVDYLKRVWEHNKKQEIRYAIYFLSILLEERNEIESMIKYQFALLFTAVFMSLNLLLIVEAYYVIYGIFFKLIVYLTFSISIAALLTTIRGIFKLTQAAKFH